MSLANDLLRSLAVDEDDGTLVIDHYTRSITIPKSITTLGVESDDEVLRLSFRMPRYLGTVDLLKFSIRVNYINAKGEDGLYKVTDSRVDGDDILFSWLVGPTATAYKGNTRFNVDMVITDSESVILNKYSTAIATLPVLEGLEVGEDVITRYVDILEQWERRLFGAGDTVEADIEAASQRELEHITQKGAEVLATIPDDYTTAVRMTDNVNRTKADAIICSTEGEVVKMEDSSDDYLRGLRLYGMTTQVRTTGKNMLSPFTKGTAISTTNGSEYVSSVAAITDFIPVDFNVYPKYHLSGLLNTLYSFAAAYNANYEFLGRSSAGANSELTLKSTYFSGGTAVGTGDIAYIRVSIYENKSVVNGDIDDIDYMEAQLEPGDVATIYEPYSGGLVSPSPEWPQPFESIENPVVEICGKNLLNHELLVGGSFVKEDDGYKFTRLENTATSAICPLNLPAGEYVLSWGEIERTCESYRVYIGFADGAMQLTGLTDLGTDYLKIVTDVGIKDMRLSLASNVTVGTHVKFAWLQLEEGDKPTGYEPYVERQVFDVNHTLPGIQVTSGGNYTDSNGQQWICDEIDFERGVYVQRIKRETLTFTKSTFADTPLGYRYQYHMGSMFTVGNVCMCTTFPYNEDVGTSKATTDGIRVNNTAGYFIVQYTDTDGNTNTIDVDVMYILATPIEIPLSASEIEAFKKLHSNYPHTIVFNDAGATMRVAYNADTKTWIENLIEAKIATYLNGADS